MFKLIVNFAPIISAIVTLIAMLALIAATCSENWFLADVCDQEDFTFKLFSSGDPALSSCVPSDESNTTRPSILNNATNDGSICDSYEHFVGTVRIGLFSVGFKINPAQLGERTKDELSWEFFAKFGTRFSNRDYVRMHMLYGGIFPILIIAIALCIAGMLFSGLNSYQVVTTWWRGPASIYIINFFISFFAAIALGLAIDLYYFDLRLANLMDYNLNIYTRVYPGPSFYVNIVGVLLPLISVGLGRFEAWRVREKEAIEIAMAVAPPPYPMPASMPMLPYEPEPLPQKELEFDVQELTIPMALSDISIEQPDDVHDEMHF